MVVSACTYFKCDGCAAVFLDPAQRLGRDDEYSRYLTHNNEVTDPAYRAFLSKVCVPLLEQLAPASTILDYGCGPGPALADMLLEAGHSVQVYDPFFYPNQSPLAQCYDAITCTEVAEHLYEPAVVFDTLAALLKPQGWLALMTCFLPESNFENWHYRRDPTHVVFYSAETFLKMPAFQGWHYLYPQRDVVLLQKPIS